MQRGRAHAICSFARHRYRGNSSSSYVQQVSIPPPPSAVLLPTPSSPSVSPVRRQNLVSTDIPPYFSPREDRKRGERRRRRRRRETFGSRCAAYVTHFFPVITARNKGLVVVVDRRSTLSLLSSRHVKVGYVVLTYRRSLSTIQGQLTGIPSTFLDSANLDSIYHPYSSPLQYQRDRKYWPNLI